MFISFTLTKIKSLKRPTLFNVWELDTIVPIFVQVFLTITCPLQLDIQLSIKFDVMTSRIFFNQITIQLRLCLQYNVRELNAKMLIFVCLFTIPQFIPTHYILQYKLYWLKNGEIGNTKKKYLYVEQLVPGRVWYLILGILNKLQKW